MSISVNPKVWRCGGHSTNALVSTTTLDHLRYHSQLHSLLTILPVAKAFGLHANYGQVWECEFANKTYSIQWIKEAVISGIKKCEANAPMALPMGGIADAIPQATHLTITAHNSCNHRPGNFPQFVSQNDQKCRGPRHVENMRNLTTQYQNTKISNWHINVVSSWTPVF